MHTRSPAIERGFFLPQSKNNRCAGALCARGSGALRPARACIHMGLCVTHIREAILSRSKGFSPLGWCVGIVGGNGFARRSLGVVSVPPMVGRGVVVSLWGCVWA